MSKTVLIAESNKVYIEALAGTLSDLGFSVVGTTSKKTDLVALAQKTMPDLLVYDFGLSTGGIAGLSDLKRLKARLPKMKILVVSIQEATDQYVEKIFDSGVDGYWNKFDDRAGFLETLNLLFP